MPSPWPLSVVARSPVAVGSVVWRMGGVLRATVVVKATFGFVLDGAARLLPPREIARDDRGHEAAAETAPFLPGAGVILTGHACAPGAVPAPSMAVRLALYREHALLDKTLHVFGDRAAPGAPPQPFQRMPIGWDRAFGGPGCHDNPAGVGFDPSVPRASPNVVDPADPRRPAGFGPIPRPWRPRRRRIGTMDPFFDAASGAGPLDLPDGIDFRFFQAAPADQQTPYLRGDEWIVVDGLHPTALRARTRLPGARAEARLYAAPARGAGSGAPAEPVALEADTLVIDADQLVCSVVWRGCFRLAGAPEQVHVHAGLALPGHPIAWAPGAEPAARLAALEGTVTLTDDLLPEDDPGGGATGRIVLPRMARSVLPFQRSAPAEEKDQHPASSSPHPPAPPPTRTPGDALDDDDRTGAVDLRAGRDLPFFVPAPVTRSAAETLDDDDRTGAVDLRMARELPFFAPPPAPRTDGPSTPHAPLPGAPWSGVPAPAPAPAAPAATLEILVSPSLRAHPDAAPTPPAPVAAPPPSPLPPPEPQPPPEPAPPPPPPVRPAEGPASALRDRVLAALAAREALRGLDLRGADLRGIDWSGAVLASCKLAGANLGGGTFTNARLAGADLSGADLSHADLSGADLSGADLSRATLAGASFAGASLTDANLSAARGPGARFTGAAGLRPSFARGVWDGADFQRIGVTGADFSGASLAEARFDGATLIDVRLEDVRAAGASFDGARMPRAHAELAALPRASFRGAEAPGSVWDRAVLDEAVFAEADLAGADFSRASCERASFAGARAAGVNLSRVAGDGMDLTGAVLEGADLRQARLREARAEKANLRGVNAQRVDLTRACLAGADLGGGNLRGGKLTGASLVGAVLEGADLRDADLERADVTGAARKTAKTSGANVKDLVGGEPG